MSSDITALIRTIGRDTLINSINNAMKEFEHVIVVADNIDLNFENLPNQVLYLKNTEVIDSYGGAAINLGAQNCTTKYICLLDDDDEYVDGAGHYMNVIVNSEPSIDIWIPGLRYNDGLMVCMQSGLYAGNVAVPTYKTEILKAYPFYKNMSPDPRYTDFYHVNNIAMNGYSVGWYNNHLYNVRPNLPGRNGAGIK
jgi:glycosyltransferase involved in cell wall biosynthesis